MKSKIIFILLFLGYFTQAKNSFSSNDSIQKTKTRKIVFGTISGAAAAGSLVYLNQAWYKSYASGNFHFFPDGREWLQMDKAGHFWTTYQCGRLMMQAMQWAGWSEKKCLLIGGTSGLAYMTAIEIMDGFSAGYGFSWSDMGANAAGSLVVIGQQHFLHEQRVSVKFSFHQTSFPQYRPSLLGGNLGEQVLKDYNGQTYWLSVNIYSFFKESKFPKWLNVAVGYGASNMIGGNNYVYVTRAGQVIGNDRYRRCFLSLDVDLTKIKTKSKFLKTLFSALNCFKIPFPALEFSRDKVGGYAIYY